MATKHSIIGLKELRERTDSYITRVKKGESFTVVRRSQPIFKLTPVDTEETGWERVIDFTKINKRGVLARDVIRAIRLLNG